MKKLPDGAAGSLVISSYFSRLWRSLLAYVEGANQKGRQVTMAEGIRLCAGFAENNANGCKHYVVATDCFFNLPADCDNTPAGSVISLPSPARAAAFKVEAWQLHEALKGTPFALEKVNGVTRRKYRAGRSATLRTDDGLLILLAVSEGVAADAKPPPALGEYARILDCLWSVLADLAPVAGAADIYIPLPGIGAQRSAAADTDMLLLTLLTLSQARRRNPCMPAVTLELPAGLYDVALLRRLKYLLDAG